MDHFHHHGCSGEIAPSANSTQSAPGGLKKHHDQLPTFITEQGDLQTPAKHMDFALHQMLMMKQ